MPVLGNADREPGKPKAQGGSAYRPGSAVYPPVSAVAGGAGPRTCAASHCTGGWKMPWKNRRRPVLEGQWGCSSRCLESMVRAAVLREAGERGAEEEVAHRHRVPLGLVLLAQGWITHPQLQTALEAQRRGGEGRIGRWLTDGCGLGEEQIARGLGMQWSCPVLSLDRFSPEAMAVVMPKRFIAEFGVVPLRVAASSLLYLAFADGLNAAVSLAVERMSGITVESGLLGETDFSIAKSKVLAADGVAATMGGAGDADVLAQAMAKMLEQRQPVAARVVRVHGYLWLRMWLETGAMGRAGTIPGGTADVEDRIFELRPARA